MKLTDILKNVGTAVLKSAVPGGSEILAFVNEMLPSDEQLGSSASGSDVTAAISSLPDNTKALLLERQFDVEIAKVHSWTLIQQALNHADASGASTRPRIAIMMAQVVVFAVIVFMGLWAVAVIRNQSDVLTSLTNSWPLVLSVLATPMALLRAYFGLRTEEKTSRYAAAAGQPKSNFVADIFKAIRK